MEIFNPETNVAQFEDHVPNIANRTDDCSGCAPYILLSLVDLEGGWNEVVGGHTTIAVQWDVTTPEPIDHIDIRLYRMQSSSPYQVLIKQFTIKPEVIDGIEKIPGSISFDPRRYDQSFQWNTNETVYKSYLVHASVVDKLGKGSHVSCRQINLKYIPIQDSEDQLSEDQSSFWSVMMVPDPLPSMGCHPSSTLDSPGGIYFDLPENTIEAQYYEYERDGGTRQTTTFRPYQLVIDGTVGEKLYFTNNDSVPHRLISVYNPVYRETDAQRNNGDNPHTIGGVSGLDFGFGSASAGSAGVVGKGFIAKSKFQDNDLVLRLLSENVLKNVSDDSDRVSFDVSIANEGQLRERLEQLEGIEIGSLLAIWQQSREVEVAPGATVEITVPASESGERHRVRRVWTLWDFTDNSGQVDSIDNIYDRTVSRKRIKIRVWYPED